MKLAFNAGLDDLKLDLAEFRAYCHILRRGECWESIPESARHCEMSESTYRRAVQRLVFEHSLVSFQERKGRTTVYRALLNYEEKGPVMLPEPPLESDTPPVPDLTPPPVSVTPAPIKSDTPPVPDLTPKVVQRSSATKVVQKEVGSDSQKSAEEMQRSDAQHLQKLVGKKVFDYNQVQDNFAHWYELYPRELIEAAVIATSRIANAKKRFVWALVDILNDAAWHLDPELERLAKELLRSAPKIDGVYEARVPFGPGKTIMREVRVMRVVPAGIEVVVKQPSQEQGRNYDFCDMVLPPSSLVEYKRMARQHAPPAALAVA